MSGKHGFCGFRWFVGGSLSSATGINVDVTGSRQQTHRTHQTHSPPGPGDERGRRSFVPSPVQHHPAPAGSVAIWPPEGRTCTGGTHEQA